MRDHLLGNPALCALIADTYELERQPQRTPHRARETENMRTYARKLDEATMAVLDASLVASKPVVKAKPLIKNAVYRVAFHECGKRCERYALWLGDKWGMYARLVANLYESPSRTLNDGRVVEVLGPA